LHTLHSEHLEFQDATKMNEYYFQKGWTDGFPIIPPTPELVEKMLNHVRLEGSEVIGSIPERNRVITAEKLAINAVMAGCLPIYMPVVLAAMGAVLDPEFGVHGPTASTGGAGIFIVVNGPITKQIGLNSGKRLLNSNNRANATIGRAIMLTLHNAGGSNEFDQSTIGHPGKLSYVMAEQERAGWTPYHVEMGFDMDENTVTVFAAEAPNQINNHVADSPEGILNSVAERMTALATFHMQRDTQCAIILCPEHMTTIIEHGWNKQMVKDYLFEKARRNKNDLYRYGLLLEPVEEHEVITAVPSVNDIIVLTGGGPAGRFSSLLPGWGSIHQTRAVTRRIVQSGIT
jgi:hypothetical protein